MTLTKKHWTAIVALIIVIILVWYFFLRKKPVAIASAPATTPPATSENGFSMPAVKTMYKSPCRICLEAFSMDCKSASSTVMQTPGLAKFNQAMWDNAVNKLIACAKTTRTGKKATFGPTCMSCINTFLMDLKGASSTVMQTPGYVTFNEVMLENAANKLFTCGDTV